MAQSQRPIFFNKITEALKKCDLSDAYCDKCIYKRSYPNSCIKELHVDASNLLKETYEMAEFYSRKVKE